MTPFSCLWRLRFVILAAWFCFVSAFSPVLSAQETETDRQALAKLRARAEGGEAEAQFEMGLDCSLGKFGMSVNHFEGAQWLRKAAEQNHAKAQYNLAWKYYDGSGVGKDLVEAVRWWGKAAEQNDALAQNNLGLCYDNGLGVAKNPAEAVKWWRRAAEQGLAPAQYNLGEYYSKGPLKDEVEAVKWYRKAAEQENASAQYNLGVCYSEGLGVTKNPMEAVKWWRKAAEQDYPMAQHNLGNSYREGQGVPMNMVEAVKWYLNAAEQNFAPAQNDLGVCYANGLGVKKDLTEAYKWLLLATAQGDELARNTVNRLEHLMGRQQIAQGQHMASDFHPRKVRLSITQHGPSRNNALPNLAAQAGFGNFTPPEFPLSNGTRDEAGGQLLPDLGAKAAAGDAQAQNELGEALYTGKGGLAKNAERAVQWFRQAAEQNFAEAQYNLGQCYESGNGLPKYEVEAYKWYLLAANQGHTKAKRNASMLELMLSPEQIAEGKNRATEWFAQANKPSRSSNATERALPPKTAYPK